MGGGGDISKDAEAREPKNQLRNIGLGSLTTPRTDLLAHPHHLLSRHPFWDGVKHRSDLRALAGI